jgi:ABC-type polysaccharide/polyol phosphate export permease
MSASLLSRATLSRALVLAREVTRMEFQRRFAGSRGGALWVFLTPAATILAIWFAIGVGLGMHRTGGVEFGVALIVGLAAWFFFADGVTSSVGAITSQPHLVKKVAFPVVLLPLAQVAVASCVHGAILVLVTGVLFLLGWRPGAGLFALPFWFACMALLTAAVAMFAAGVNVIARDASAVVPGLVGFLFWLTPVVWPLSLVPEDWRALALVNPLAVVVEGYRAAYLDGVTLAAAPGAIAFAALVAALAFASYMAFRRLRRGFADVM